MKLWYYPWIYKLPPKDRLPEMLQSIEIPDEEGKKRLCEHNQIISYEYAQYIKTILGGSVTEESQQRLGITTMGSDGPDSPQSGGTSQDEGAGSKFF